MKIKSIWDNEGKTMDRYTIVFHTKGNGNLYKYSLSLSYYPDGINGFSQYGQTVEGNHLGRRIKFEDLPEQVKKHIKDKKGIMGASL